LERHLGGGRKRCRRRRNAINAVVNAVNAVVKNGVNEDVDTRRAAAVTREKWDTHMRTCTWCGHAVDMH
tara:strand:+ start:297 stop:503 length:207 start_codon:yes stop_codon:yes gene_type:complete